MKTCIPLLLAMLLGPVTVQAQTYVAVGDSLAFGFQEAKFYSLLLNGTYDPSAFNTGFVDVIDGMVRPYWPNLQTVNFSCPGETTSTMLQGGCPLHNWLFALPLHQNYPGSTPQIYAAIQYLQAHPNEVAFITLTIGGNDILQLFSDCGNDMTCVAQGLPNASTQAAQRVALAVQVLKSLSPQSVILYTNVPDPYIFSNPASVATFESFNGTVGAAAVNSGARLVDWFGAQKQLDQATFCVLTYVCQAPLYDIHPTDIGYQFLGYQALQVLFQ